MVAQNLKFGYLQILLMKYVWIRLIRMNIVNCTFAFLFLACFQSYSQNNYKVIYDITIQEKRSDKNEDKSEMDKEMDLLTKKMLNTANNMQFALIFNNKKSLFHIVDKLSVDNREEAKYSIPILNGISAAFPIYIDLASQSFFKKIELGGANHLIRTPLDMIHWDITDDVKTMDNYILKKAKSIHTQENGTKLEITAWFCPEIAVPFGPAVYNGLPGLIMDLEVKEVLSEYKKLGFTYHFRIKSLKTIPYEEIAIPIKDYQILTEEQSEAVFRRMNGNFNPNRN